MLAINRNYDEKNKVHNCFVGFLKHYHSKSFALFSFHFDVPTKVLNKLGITITSSVNKHYEYTDNFEYNVRRSLFEVYQPKDIRIVMLGDSITDKVDWNELLSRTDVVNRGIGSDITEGFINRLSDIYVLNPETCFIMGGIN